MEKDDEYEINNDEEMDPFDADYLTMCVKRYSLTKVLAQLTMICSHMSSEAKEEGLIGVPQLWARTGMRIESVMRATRRDASNALDNTK